MQVLKSCVRTASTYVSTKPVMCKNKSRAFFLFTSFRTRRERERERERERKRGRREEERDGERREQERVKHNNYTSGEPVVSCGL